MTTLTAQHLMKTYRGKKIVKEVSLRIASGEVVGLLGPNGAGKTTSFYMMLGIIPADGGTITLANQNITPLPIHQRAKLGIGYLPQEPSIFRKLSVEDNIKAILELQQSLDDSTKETLLETLLVEFKISHIRKLKGHQLSGGERRRVEIARALAGKPKFILLDEPFAGIDPLSILDIKALVRHLKNQGIGILITDHNVRDTLDICDRAYIMNHGEVIAEGNLEEILSNTTVREVYLGEKFTL